MQKLTVTFRSEHEEIACRLFEQSLGLEPENEFHISATLALVHYHFPDDELLREARSWGADALGCGLITMFSTVVE